MQAYAKGKRVGHGTYGTVYRATHIETGTVVAIKKIRNANGVLSAEPYLSPPSPSSLPSHRTRTTTTWPTHTHAACPPRRVWTQHTPR